MLCTIEDLDSRGLNKKCTSEYKITPSFNSFELLFLVIQNLVHTWIGKGLKRQLCPPWSMGIPLCVHCPPYPFTHICKNVGNGQKNNANLSLCHKYRQAGRSELRLTLSKHRLSHLHPSFGKEKPGSFEAS